MKRGELTQSETFIHEAKGSFPKRIVPPYTSTFPPCPNASCTIDQHGNHSLLSLIIRFSPFPPDTLPISVSLFSSRTPLPQSVRTNAATSSIPPQSPVPTRPALVVLHPTVLSFYWLLFTHVHVYTANTSKRNALNGKRQTRKYLAKGGWTEAGKRKREKGKRRGR